MRPLIALWGLLTLLTSNAVAQVTLTPTTKTVGPGAISYEVLVDTGSEWTASADASWVTVTPNPGRGQIIAKVFVEANTSTSSRTATITIGTATQTLTQSGTSAAGYDLLMTGDSQSGQLGTFAPPHTRPSSVWSNVALASAGGGDTLFVKTDGTLWAVGYNGSGQLGDGSTTNRSSPVQVAAGVASVSAGGNHTLFIKTDGSLWAMGLNSSGQLGDSSITNRSTPVLIATGVASVSTGSSHTLFVKTDGSLWAMGYNNYGQLGDGSTTNRSTPVQVATSVASVSAGGSHTLFVKTDGSLWAMGYNYYGQLGDGGSSTYRSTPVQVATGVSSVDTGNNHTLFVKTDGSLWAMGYNGLHELGDGTTTHRYSPVQITTGVTSVSAGNNQTFFVKTDGSLWAMGDNSYGQLGDGSITNRSTPVQVATNAASVSTAGGFTLFVKTDGSLWAMGLSSSGQLGDGSTTFRSTPIQISAETTKGSAGSSQTFFVKTDTSLWAVGANNYGQLGDGSTANRSAPAQIATDVASVASGQYHTLFIKTDGSLWATGRNNYGQLGDSSFTNRSTPVQVATGVASVSAGGNHTLFVKNDGSLWAMGLNSSGQLGDGSITTRSTPVQIATGVASASTGGEHSLFIKTDGSLWTMGLNSSGQLGNGFTANSPTPVQVATGIASVSAGGNHTLFVKTDGSLWAVGNNFYGQLGDGSNTNRKVPVLVATGVASVSPGGNHTLFVKTDGSLWTMGLNSSGQLGDGSTTNRSTPVQIASGIAAAYAGGSHSAILATASVYIGSPPKTTPTLSWSIPANVTYGTALSATQLSATSIVAGTFTYSPTIGTVLNAGTHTLSVTFTPTDTTNYNSATATQQLTVTPATASITLGTLSTTYNGAPHSATATTSPAGLSIALTYDGSATPPTAIGSYAVVATITNPNYTGSASGTLTIAKGVPVISWSTPDAIPYGTAVSTTQLNATANVPGTLSYDVAAGVTLNAGSHTITANFVPSDTANYDSVSLQRTLVVTPLVPVITWATPTPIVFGTALSTEQLNATADVPGTFVYSPAAGSVISAGTPNLSVTFTPTDSVNYSTVTVTRAITVSKAPATVTLSDLSTTYTGSPHTASATTSPNGLGVTFTYDGSSTPPTAIGTYTVVGTINSNDYTGSATGTFTIGKAVATVTLSNLTQAYDGTPKSVTATTSPAELSVQLLYDGAAQAPSAAGSYTVTATVIDSLYTGSASGTLQIAGPATVSLGSSSETVNQGDSLTLVATANGVPPFSYQWFKDGSPIEGATGSTLTISVADANSAGSYTVQVTNPGGSTTSSPTIVSVTLKPTLTGGTSNVPLTSDLLLEAPTTGGTPPFTYQWKKNGQDIPDANSPTLHIPNATTADAGEYTVYVTNAAGSGSKVFIVRGPPIVEPLGNLVVNPGGTAQFTTTFLGAAPVTLQWLHDGVAIAGATDDVLTISNAQPTHTGIYSFRVRDAFGETIKSATLKLSQTISFTPPSSVPQGDTPVPLSASASSGLPVTIKRYGYSESITAFIPVTWGEALLIAEQAGNDVYAPAAPVEGHIHVTSRYETWNQEHFTEAEQADPSISGPNADPDHDALNNLAEYALGLNPRRANSSPVRVALVDGFMTFIYQRPSDRLDLNYSVEVSRDLHSWTSTGIVPALAADDTTTQTWHARFVTSDKNPVFFRLVLTR